MLRFRSSSIEIKTPSEIEAMRVVGRMAGETLTLVGEMIRPGISTEEINEFVHEDTIRRGATPAPLNYKGFPKSVCTSINEVVCHGIPTPDAVLQEGDIINVDVTHIYKGFHGDTSATFYVGQPSEQAKKVTEVARRCLELGIAEVRPGGRIGDIGAAIQDFAESHELSVVQDFVGHGIGRVFHSEPQVPHYGQRGRGPRLRPGMIFTIEPMINLGGYECEILDDGWTAVTSDGSLSAQFEHTIVVTEEGHEVLTQRSKELAASELFPDYFGPPG
jgi:methionyl aminopeptidase